MKAYKAPKLVELGTALELVQSGGDCHLDSATYWTTGPFFCSRNRQK